MEDIKSRAEKARLIGFDKKESPPDMIRTTLSFIDKKVEQNEYNGQPQRERSNNFNKQNYTKYYNNRNANQYNSNRKNTNLNKNRTTNRIDEFNEKLCKMYYDMNKHKCGERCNREDVDAFHVGRRQWKTYWFPKYNDGKLFEKDNYKNFVVL